MSKYAIPTLSDEELDAASTPNIGAALKVFVSTDEVKPIGKLVQDAVDSTPDGDEGTLTLDRTYTAPEAVTSGRDVQVALASAIKSSAAVTVAQFNVTYPSRTLPAATVSTGAGSQITFASAHNLATGDTVTLTGSGNTPSISATHTVTVVSATVVTLQSVTITTAGTVSAATGIHTGTASASFSAADYADDATGALPQGTAVDLTPDEAYYAALTTGIRTVNSLAGITGGAKGAKFTLVALPVSDDWYEIPGAVDKNIVYPTFSSVPIPERYDPARWNVKGRGENPTLDISARGITFGRGLARYNGQSLSVKIETHHDDELLVQRMVFGHCRLTMDGKGADGNEPTMNSAKGSYTEFLVFI